MFFLGCVACGFSAMIPFSALLWRGDWLAVSVSRRCNNGGRFSMRLSRFRLALLVVPSTLISAGCSSLPQVPSVVSEYRIDIQQGNVITQDMVAQLKPGLSKEQVRYILGSPMLLDVFHADRWDYVYTMKKGSSDIVENRRFSVFFAESKLQRVAGDVVAAAAAEAKGEAVAQPENKARIVDLGSLPPGAVPPPDEDGKGYWGRLIDKLKF